MKYEEKYVWKVSVHPAKRTLRSLTKLVEPSTYVGTSCKSKTRKIFEEMWKRQQWKCKICTGLYHEEHECPTKKHFDVKARVLN